MNHYLNSPYIDSPFPLHMIIKIINPDDHHRHLQTAAVAHISARWHSCGYLWMTPYVPQPDHIKNHHQPTRSGHLWLDLVYHCTALQPIPDAPKLSPSLLLPSRSSQVYIPVHGSDKEGLIYTTYATLNVWSGWLVSGGCCSLTEAV